MGLLVWCIKYLPFPFMEIVGHGTKCIFMSFGMMFVALVGALAVKDVFYRVVALVHGYEIMEAHDELYLYDLPVNRINVTGGVVFQKKKGEKFDAMKVSKIFLDRFLRPPMRRNIDIIVKKWGKYFLRRPTPEEWRDTYSKTNFAIIDDIKTEQEAVDFCLKMKATVTHQDGDMPLRFYLCPNFSETEFAILACTPHCLIDGTTFLQFINLASDELEGRDVYFPFLK